MSEIPDVLTIDPATVDSAVLRRLLAEVQQEDTTPRRGAQLYDRVHNRHNRGPNPRPWPRPWPAPESPERTIAMFECEICQKKPESGTTTFRVNEKGVPGIFRCRAHLHVGVEHVALDADLVSLVADLEDANTQTAEDAQRSTTPPVPDMAAGEGSA